MIQSTVDREIAVVAPRGYYAQTELTDAIDRALSQCPAGRARGLILDFSEALGIEHHSVVRVRETTRHLASHGERFSKRIAIVSQSDDVVSTVNIGGVISHGQGIDYHFVRDMDAAVTWLLAQGPHG